MASIPQFSLLPQGGAVIELKKKNPRYKPPKIPNGTTKNINILCNSNLYNQLVEIADGRNQPLSQAVRTLLYLGLEQWNQNKVAGATTGAKRATRKARLEAQAIADGVRLEQSRRKKKKTPEVIPAVTPLLFNESQHKEE